MNAAKKQLVWGIAASAAFLLLLQILVAPRPALHPVFPFISLDDPDLPFFNRPKFRGTLYSRYALDNYLGDAIAHQEAKPLGELTPVGFAQILHRHGDTAENSPLRDYLSEGDVLYEVRFNQHGFRGPDLPKTKERIRVVTAGDSLTFGFGLHEKDSWPTQLQNLLDADTAGASYEIINAGMIAADSTVGVEMVRRKILPLKPDLVILGYGFNDYNFNNRDFLGGASRQARNPWHEAIVRRQRPLGQVAYYLTRIRLLQLLRNGLQKLLPVPAALDDRLSLDKMKPYLASVRGRHATAPEEYESNLETMIQTLRQANIKAIVLQSNLASPFYVPQIRRVVETNQVPTADFREIFANALNRQPDLTQPETVPVLFRVQLPEARISENPKVWVLGDYFSTVEIGFAQLNDEGLEGDRVAGDRVYSAVLPILRGTLLSFHYVLESPAGEWTEEFGGWRIYRRFEVRGEPIAIDEQAPALATPIYDFDDLSDRSDLDFAFRPYMIETCHPNGAGNQLIAQEIRRLLLANPGGA